ncbi:MAG: hypothetical protein Q9190_004592, partial [Brigantiaea leucoxantha]
MTANESSFDVAHFTTRRLLQLQHCIVEKFGEKMTLGEDPKPSQHYEYLIIGAGLQALVAAKTIIHCSSPSIPSFLLLDVNPEIGGTWSPANHYPGLKTNNLAGTLEFSDFPLAEIWPEGTEGCERKHVPGPKVYEYLLAYARKWGITEHFRGNRQVLSAHHKPAGGWILEVRLKDSKGWKEEVLECEKLIVGTGLTSRPKSIDMPGVETFEGEVLTFGSFRAWAREHEGRRKGKVVVVGGSKAAFDAVYFLATHHAEQEVVWVITESGHGPVWMLPPHIYLGPFKCWVEKLTSTRVLTWFSPCIWGSADGFSGIRTLLHGTRAGRWIVRTFWKKLTSDAVYQLGLLRRGEEVKKLMPREGTVWYGAGISIFNYDADFLDLVESGRVKVVRKDIAGLERNAMRFKDGTEEAGVGTVIVSTGWDWTCGVEFWPKEEHARLGIPSADYSRAQTEEWNDLERRADVEILERFPMLLEAPGLEKGERLIPKPPNNDERLLEEKTVQPQMQEYTPWRLFRGIAPPANPYHDVVFLGMMINLQTFVRSEIASLWAYAYLN